MNFNIGYTLKEEFEDLKARLNLKFRSYPKLTNFTCKLTFLVMCYCIIDIYNASHSNVGTNYKNLKSFDDVAVRFNFSEFYRVFISVNELF